MKSANTPRVDRAMDRLAAASMRITLAEIAWLDRVLVRAGRLIDVTVARAERVLGGKP